MRPLNDAKAIANGANAISEGFLFFVAAALILGETYRGSRKKAEQRDRTEDSLNQLKDQVEGLAKVMGVDLEQLALLADKDSDEDDGNTGPSTSGSRVSRGESRNGDVTEEADPSLIEARLRVYRDRQDEELKSRQLQAAVSVLLDLALKNRWVVGPEALELQDILGNGPSEATQQSPSQPAPSQDTTEPSYTQANTSDTTDEESAEGLRPSIIQQVALERAKALAREVRGEADSNPQVDASLASLLAQHRPSTST